ncbi:hypothetical protein Bbelb_346670 [Branchiostoma belcheri]|nr:hypothetical protein Bbelb_346670 [Branchiostoma belcheri]
MFRSTLTDLPSSLEVVQPRRGKLNIKVTNTLDLQKFGPIWGLAGLQSGVPACVQQVVRQAHHPLIIGQQARQIDRLIWGQILPRSRYQPDRASDRPTAEGRREIRSAGGLGPRAVRIVITRAGTPVSNVIAAQTGEMSPHLSEFRRRGESSPGKVPSPVYTETLTCLHRYPHLSTQKPSAVYTGTLTCLHRYPHLSTQVPSPVYTGILICLCRKKYQYPPNLVNTY